MRTYDGDTLAAQRVLSGRRDYNYMRRTTDHIMKKVPLTIGVLNEAPTVLQRRSMNAL
jgi:hypothetical protein